MLCVDANGNTPVCSLQNGRNEFQTSLNVKCTETIKEYIASTNGCVWNYKIVTPDSLYANKPSNVDEKGNEWHHYSYIPEKTNSNIMNLTIKGKSTLYLLEKALNKYGPLMVDLFQKMDTKS